MYNLIMLVGLSVIGFLSFMGASIIALLFMVLGEFLWSLKYGEPKLSKEIEEFIFFTCTITSWVSFVYYITPIKNLGFSVEDGIIFLSYILSSYIFIHFFIIRGARHKVSKSVIKGIVFLLICLIVQIYATLFFIKKGMLLNLISLGIIGTQITTILILAKELNDINKKQIKGEYYEI